MIRGIFPAIVVFAVIFAGLALRSFIHDTIFNKGGSFKKDWKFAIVLALMGAIAFFIFENC